MRPRHILSPTAAADLADIDDYHGERSPRYAVRVLRELRKTFQTVGRFPLIGSPVPHLLTGLRKKPAGMYIVYFRPAATGTEIVRIFHGSRDIGPEDFAELDD